MIWDFKNYIFWVVQVPSAIVLWTCAITVILIIIKATIQEIFKRGGKDESK